MDKRVFFLKAERSKEKHLTSEINYQEASAILFIDEEKINSQDFLVSLKKCLSHANNWEIDVSSFVSCCSPNFGEYNIELLIKSLRESLNREPVSFKSENKEESKVSIKLINSNSQLKEIDNIVKGESQAKRWAEMPPNILTPKKFVEELTLRAKEIGVNCQVFDWEELKKRGFNLICAVGQNKKSSYLVTLSQSTNISSNRKRKKIALIGKGICFDTGGLSLKTGNYMRDMKFDMSGASLVASIFFALAESNCINDCELVALLPISENLIGSDSVKVDSVISSFGGESIEISNTDAEGRLLLAEAISYAAKELDASEIITVATLTGAVKYALGNKYAGVWTTSQKSWKEFEDAAFYSGDYIWRLPLDKIYLKEMKSGIADLKNAASTGAAGASRAASFLAEFRENKEFIHCDIANVSNSEDKENIGLAPLFKTIYFYIRGIGEKK